MSRRTHSPHRGVRATQTRRPCQMNRCDSRVQSVFGNNGMSSRSMVTGSVDRVRPNRALRRVSRQARIALAAGPCAGRRSAEAGMSWGAPLSSRASVWAAKGA